MDKRNFIKTLSLGATSLCVPFSLNSAQKSSILIGAGKHWEITDNKISYSFDGTNLNKKGGYYLFKHKNSDQFLPFNGFLNQAEILHKQEQCWATYKYIQIDSHYISNFIRDEGKVYYCSFFFREENFPYFRKRCFINGSFLSHQGFHFADLIINTTKNKIVKHKYLEFK